MVREDCGAEEAVAVDGALTESEGLEADALGGMNVSRF